MYILYSYLVAITIQHLSPPFDVYLLYFYLVQHLSPRFDVYLLYSYLVQRLISPRFDVSLLNSYLVQHLSPKFDVYVSTEKCCDPSRDPRELRHGDEVSISLTGSKWCHLVHGEK